MIPIFRDGSHPLPRSRNLERRLKIWQQRDHLGSGKGKLGWTGVEETMPKRVDPVAVDRRHGAIRADAHVAGEELHADHRPRFETPRIAQRVVRLAATRNTLTRIHSQSAELRAKMIERR